MKKSIILLLFAVFSLSAAAATYYEIKGDKQEAARYEIVCLGSLMIPAMHSMRLTQTMGITQNFYPDNAPRLYSRAHKHLLDYLDGKLSAGNKPNVDLLRALANGNLKIMPYQQSLRFVLTPAGGNRQELLNSVTATVQGQIPTEFDKGQLPGGSILAFDYLRLGYATDSTATTPRADVDFTNIVDNWPPALRNADLIWTQMSDLKFRMGASAFGVKAASTQAAVKSDGYNFPEPIIIEEKKQNMIELYCPANVVIPSAGGVSYFLEITIDGAAIIATR